MLIDSTALLLMGPSVSPGSCPHALTAAWELSPADFACSSAGDSQQGRIWWWCVQWCRLDRFAGISPWLILRSHGLPTGSERQHNRTKIMEHLWGSKKFHDRSGVYRIFIWTRVLSAETNANLYGPHKYVSSNPATFTNPLIFLRDVMLKQSEVTGLKKEKEIGTEPKAES